MVRCLWKKLDELRGSLKLWDPRRFLNFCLNNFLLEQLWEFVILSVSVAISFTKILKKITVMNYL